jgi:cytochrome c oxidase accessory protein FixG
MGSAVDSSTPFHDGGAEVQRTPPPAIVETPDGPLYAARVKVYPRKVSGRYRSLKWAVLVACLAVYYAAPWLRWDRGPGAPDQALMIDMTNARAYFLWIEIWPQEVYFITGLLILGAIALFAATSLFGRVWCGYACPQTVWTDLFMLVERLIEGDRNARMRLDNAPLSAGKGLRKVAKHVAWLAISAATGGAWLLYFADAPTLIGEFFRGGASTGQYFFFGLFTATTYTLAGWAREQVCTYMCPWPRFQGAMQDEHTLAVTYQRWRGEKRAKAPKNNDWSGRGDCIDCKACIAVCPTGIDIRDGQQLECIGCGLCIDACNDVMGKVGRPLNLIAFATAASQDARAAAGSYRYRLVRPRTVVYAVLLVLVSAIMVAALATRSEVELTVQADRNPLFVLLSDGGIRNTFTIKISNKTRQDTTYRVGIEGIGGATLVLNGAREGQAELAVSVPPDHVTTLRVFVRIDGSDALPERQPFDFVLNRDGGETVRHGAIFNAPGK